VCRNYTPKQLRSKAGRWKRAEAMERLMEAEVVPDMVRPTLPGPVLLGDGRARLMSWGFRRVIGGQGVQAIVNARSEKIREWPWLDAWTAGRRCLVPVGAWFEFTGEKGAKRPMEFRSPDGGWLWAAGLWEASPNHGECYTMLMTEPNGFMLPFYDRMPALLAEGEAEAYLDGAAVELRPATVALEAVTPAVHPITGKPVPPEQPRLF